MKNLTFIFIFYFNFNLGYSQDSIIKSLDVISTPALSKPRPIDYDISDWNDSMKKDLKEKWSLSFSEVILSFIVGKNGEISNLKIYSEEWRPSEEEISELLNMIHLKGKWIPGSTNNESLRTTYTIKMLFQQ